MSFNYNMYCCFETNEIDYIQARKQLTKKRKDEIKEADKLHKSAVSHACSIIT